MELDRWDIRWPDFTKDEIKCPLTGLLGIREEAMDAIQGLRYDIGEPLVINSAYRSPEHNKAVGGVLGSYHVKGLAFDISLRGHDKWELLRRAKLAGFSGFGFYKNFLHVDLGPVRHWGHWS